MRMLLRKKSFYTILALLLLILSGISCDSAKRREVRASRADSVLFNIGVTMNYERLRAVADSFEIVGDISQLNANRWRGVAYYHEGQYRMAELCYRKALECEVKTALDQLSYNKCARRLSEILLVKGDFEGSLQVAIPAVKRMDKTGIGSDIDYAILLNNIGCCQLNLGRDQEASKSFMAARDHYANRWQTDSTSRGFQEAVQGTVYTSLAYINTRRYAESIYWIDRTEMLLDKYRERPDARKEYFDEYQGRIEIMRAVALQGLEQIQEAAQAYKRFLQTAYSKTDAGRINANDYLVAAHRYREAADNYRFLDKMLQHWGMKPSLDNILLYMLPKYHANEKAGRMDSARVVADRIFSLLGDAITNQKNSSTAELATIYNTNEKEAEIHRQQNKMSRMRFITMVAILVLIVIIMMVYMLLKRQSARRLRDAHAKLEDAHSKLQSAYGQLEETTKAKERIESELRIARDIQNSMVPHVFPHREGLDIYGSMTPAKEVGGDLYAYALIDDMLYFCVGDVSGKGVPAALFMAEVTRMFRTLVDGKLTPGTIATRLNHALAEDNEQGMFVTMFIGLINLKTGHMEYCNAGHNPPLLDGEYMKMESNAPIGLWSEVEFEGEEVDDMHGKTLFVYTDGISEAENVNKEQFGDERLQTLLKQDLGDARQTSETIHKAVADFVGDAEPSDDLTKMCIIMK